MALEKSTLDALRIERAPETRPKPRYWLLAAVLLLLLLGAAAWWFTSRERVTEVRTQTVREANAGGQRTLLNASGYVVARRQATVSAKVTGKIAEVLVEEGMKVTAGQVLARLDAVNVEASLGLAEAQLNATKTSLDETRVRLQQAEREFKRISDLAQRKISSEAELDQAQAEFNSQRARLEKQQADVTVAEREIAVLRQQLEDMVIRAPFSGVVTTKDAQPGEMVSPISAGGGFTRTGICTIVDMGSLEIEVDVNESFINRVQPGQPVEAALDAYSEWKIPSKVIAIIPTADRQKATVKVRVGFEQLDPRILPQMGVKVAFRGGQETPQAQPAFMLPKTALRKDGARDVVFVVQDGRVERRAVTVGGTKDEEVAVLSGLRAGERVVVEGPETLSENEQVKEKRR
jgi:RND family efflux transporter MFP subunit